MADVMAPGLSTRQATERRTRGGANRLPASRRPSAARRLLGELTHFFALLLWAAAVLAFVADLPELSVAIVGVILLNAVFAAIQQARADRAADRLAEMLPTRVTVWRDGRRQVIEAEDVVVDDILLLESGDRVAADAVVLTENRLLVDSSMLTGESEAGAVAEGEPLFAGTFVVEGDSSARVAAIGSKTRLAGIARLATSTTKPDTPLTRGLRGVVRLTTVIAVGAGALFMLISVLVGNPLQDAFVFAIGVTVALVPEALLPTVTLSLAWGSEQMAKRQILVRNLEAVETLGSTTFICTDKTGTLTCNQPDDCGRGVDAGRLADHHRRRLRADGRTGVVLIDRRALRPGPGPSRGTLLHRLRRRGRWAVARPRGPHGGGHRHPRSAGGHRYRGGPPNLLRRAAVPLRSAAAPHVSGAGR